MKLNKNKHNPTFVPYSLTIEVETEHDDTILRHLFGCWDQTKSCVMNVSVPALAEELERLLEHD